MKKILLFLMIIAMFAACSTPKYTYYFDRYSVKNTAVLAKDKTGSRSEDIVSEKNPASIPEVITPSATISAQDQTLMASSSKRILGQSSNTISTSKVSNSTLAKITKKEKKNLMKSIKEYKTKMASPDAIKEGDKRKNGFAIAGFVSSLVGVFIPPVLVLGIVMSAIGLKSEKRKMAIAGLVISIAIVLLYALVFVFFLP